MNKIRTFTLITGISLLTALMINSATAVSGYTTITLNILGTGSALGDNTNLIRVIVTDNNDNQYDFTNDGERKDNIFEENIVIKEIDVFITINDTYADFTSEAIQYTRVGMTITSGDTTHFDNYIGIQDALQQAWAWDNGDYYTVRYLESLTMSPYRLGIDLPVGSTLTLNSNYEVNAPTS
jgi:hypothetical protein